MMTRSIFEALKRDGSIGLGRALRDQGRFGLVCLCWLGLAAFAGEARGVVEERIPRAAAGAAPVLDKGHTDIGIAFEDGAWDLHIHHETTDREYAPDEAVLEFGPSSELPISDSVNFQFLGEPGFSTWVLSQVEREDLLFLGLAAEEIEEGVFAGNVVRVELVSVEGPGNFFVWTADPLGKPILHFNSADGVAAAADFYSLKTGGHQDMNWAFSAPGTYRVGYRASGTLAAGNEFKQSEVAYYTFRVPEAKLPQPEGMEGPGHRYLATELGTLGGASSRALGINDAGDAAGEAMLPDGNTRAVVWRGTEAVDLGTLGGDRSEAYAINNGGFVTGRSRNAAGRDRAFIYDPATKAMTELATAGGQSAGGADDGAGFGINEGNAIAGHARNAAGELEAFIWENGAAAGTGTPGGANGRAWDINESGQLAGWGRDANNGIVGYRWSRGKGFELIPTLQAGDETFGIGINDGGTVVGFSAAAMRSRAWAWDGTNVVDLGQAEGFAGGAANRVNNAGEVVGVSFRFNANGDRIDNSATWWHGEHVVDLNTMLINGAGWHLETAHHINQNGQIAGWGTRNGAARGFRLDPMIVLDRGHTDIGALYSTNGWEMEVHSEAMEEEFEAGSAVLRLPALARTTVPANTAFHFLGESGAPIWVLSQVEHPKLLFLGLAAEEIEKGVFVKDEVFITLKRVEGPGDFFVYGVDGFGSPVVHWNTRDGVGAGDVRTVIAGGHEDVNWAFSAPGHYQVTLEASGVLLEGNASSRSDEFTFHFEVIDAVTTMRAARKDGGDLSLSATTQEGVIYELQSAAAVTGPWNTEGQPYVGTGRVKEITVPAQAGAAFFRVITRNRE